MSDQFVKGFVKQFVSRMVDAILPVRCVSCNDKCERSFCDFCEANIEECSELSSVASSFVYSASIRSAIVRAKFGPSETCARLLAQYWVDKGTFTETFTQNMSSLPLAITFVPVHLRRRLTRGFDFSSILAQALAKHHKLPFIDILQCTQFTQPHSTGKTKAERLKKLSGRFKLRKNFINNSHYEFILIDDVVTTGATLEAAAMPLLEAGALIKKLTFASTPICNQT